MILNKYENNENDLRSSNNILNTINTIDLNQITKHPSLMKKVKITDDDQFIEFDDDFQKMETLKSILEHNKLTQTQKVIILLGTAIGIQYLHLNNLHHGEICLSKIFIDENFYPHIYLPNSDDQTLSFGEKNKNEIVDMTSLCFVAYELLIDQIVFDDNNKINENLLKFDLSKINNEWQQSFLLKFWPDLHKYTNINDIINEIIENKEKFGNIEDDKIMAYVNKIKSYQISYLKKLESDIKNNDPKKMFIYGKMLLICHFSDEDTKKAVKYLKKASKLSNVDAMYEYGMILKNGSSNECKKKALKYLEKASKDGHIGAGYEYGLLFINENIIVKIPQGIEFIKNSADKGYMMAQLFYGIFLSKLQKLKLSDTLAYYKNPADFGYALAMNNLGLFLYENDFNNNENDSSINENENENDSNENENENDSTKNENENDSNENENDSSKNENDSNENENKNDSNENDSTKNENENDSNENENNSTKNENENENENENDSNENENDPKVCENNKYITMAIHYLKMAISLRFITSLYNYGMFLLNGEKIPQNKEEGIKYIKIAADKGFIGAIKTYYKLSNDESECLKYLKIAADKEDVESMNLYGNFLRQGKIVEKDISEASRYYQLAFLNNNSNVESKFLYGKMILEENNDESGWHYINECINNFYLPAILYKLERIKIIKTKSKEEIIMECKNMADDGDVDSMYNYAVILYNGEGIEENKEEAAKYYRMAAEKGHVGAMNNYARMLYYGDGIEKNINEAAKYFKIAADNGHDISTLFAGLLMYNNEENKEEGIKYLKKAIEYGFTQPKNLYDELIKKGEIEEEKKTKTTLKLRKEIIEGNADAMFSFAIMLLNGDGIYKSRKDAAKYFKMAAEKGHIAAMKEYGLMLLNGNGIPTDKKMAAEWLKKSADKWNCYSMYLYALMLSNGDGIQKNKKEEAKYYKLSADQGLTNSMNNFGVMLYDGDGIESNKELALKYLKRAADGGFSMAQYNYGFIESISKTKSDNNNNENETSDNNESINYIKKSADDGNIDAILCYGNYLYTGHNIPVDKKEAAKYFKIGADKGSIESMHKYAEMLERGDGIPLDINEAINIYQKALLKNDPKASEKLKTLSLFFSGCL